MKCSCGCSIITGFLLGILAAAGAYFYFVMRKDPELSRKVVEIEKQWEETKETGDDVIHVIKVVAPPAPQIPQQRGL